MRHGTDHHSYVIFPRPVRSRLRPPINPEVCVNQITWQVGSLREVVEGQKWLDELKVKIYRSGRDNPGSNWHVYPVDPDGHTNELYYGIEQIGWDGFSKPKGMHRREYMKAPDLPHRSEYAEVQEGLKAGVDPRSGHAPVERLEEKYDVGGILLGRPFKVTKIGPCRIFVKDVEAATRFYRDILGLTLTEEVTWRGHRCTFLRANAEHHSLALYPLALRAELGLRPDSTMLSMGLQVGEALTDFQGVLTGLPAYGGKGAMLEAFVRGDDARTMDDRAGFGLGLAIARAVAEAHGGTLTLHDSAPQGLSARITLPVTPPEIAKMA